MGGGAFRGATGLKGHRDGPVGAGEVPVGARPGSRGAGPVWGGLGCSPRQAEGGAAGASLWGGAGC